jgi:hypothetical protein
MRTGRKGGNLLTGSSASQQADGEDRENLQHDYEMNVVERLGALEMFIWLAPILYDLDCLGGKANYAQ